MSSLFECLKVLKSDVRSDASLFSYSVKMFNQFLHCNVEKSEVPLNFFSNGAWVEFVASSNIVVLLVDYDSFGLRQFERTSRHFCLGSK